MKAFEEGFHECFPRILIQNSLVNNDDALVNVIKRSLNLKFTKSKKVSQDYLLKLVQEKKAS